jgi:hypothetical protein
MNFVQWIKMQADCLYLARQPEPGMETDRPALNLISYVCARPNLSNAVQTTAINGFTTKNAHVKILARFEDQDVAKRIQLQAALMRMKQSDCQGMIVYGISILTQNASHRQAAEFLANFLGPKASSLYEVNGQVTTETILALRNNAIAEIHRDVD